jgi:hypothetical protein
MIFWLLIAIAGAMFLISLVLLLQVVLSKYAGRNNRKS